MDVPRAAWTDRRRKGSSITQFQLFAKDPQKGELHRGVHSAAIRHLRRRSPSYRCDTNIQFSIIRRWLCERAAEHTDRRLPRTPSHGRSDRCWSSQHQHIIAIKARLCQKSAEACAFGAEKAHDSPAKTLIGRCVTAATNQRRCRRPRTPKPRAAIGVTATRYLLSSVRWQTENHGR